MVVGALALLLLLPDPTGAQPDRGPTVDPAENDFVLREGETLTETVTVDLPPGSRVDLADIYLLADTTGSMGPPLEAVQDEAVELVEGLQEELPDVELAFGVGDFKDFPDLYAFRHAQDITTDTGAVVSAIDQWVAFAGGDGPESQFYAFDQLAEDRAPSNDGSPARTIGWRTGALPIVVTFADAPAHDPVCSEVTTTVPGHGIPYDITEESVVAKFRARGIVFIGISTLTGYADGMDDDPRSGSGYSFECGEPGGTPGQATRIADATGGVHLGGVDDDEIVASIRDAVTETVSQVDAVSLEPTGDTAQFVAGIDPPEHSPVSSNTLRFEVSWSGTVAATGEDQVFTGTLDVIVDGKVVTGKPVRITVPAAGTPQPPPGLPPPPGPPPPGPGPAAPPATPVPGAPTFTG